MNDELVYALIALGLHWWAGWHAMKMVKHNCDRQWDGADELFGVFFMIVFGVAAWIVMLIYNRETSIFGGD